MGKIRNNQTLHLLHMFLGMDQCILIVYTPYWEDSLLSLCTQDGMQNMDLQNTRECTGKPLQYFCDCIVHLTHMGLGCMGQLFL